MKKIELSTELTLKRFFERNEAFAKDLQSSNGDRMGHLLNILATLTGLHPNFVKINAEDIKRLTY